MPKIYTPYNYNYINIIMITTIINDKTNNNSKSTQIRR